MTTLTRATLGKLTQRATKDIEIGGNLVRIQRPTPLEFSQYQMSLVDRDGKADIGKFADKGIKKPAAQAAIMRQAFGFR
jgi:hypothetical protein